MSSAIPHTIRDAELTDAAALADLISQLGYPSMPDDVRGRSQTIAADDTYRTFVAERNGSIVGVVGVGLANYYERNGRYARILVLSVAASERGAGVGTKLLAAAEDWARAAGATDVIVNSAHRRSDAHSFYESHGYRSTGLRFVKSLDDTRR